MCDLCKGDLLFIVLTQDKPDKTLEPFVRELRNDALMQCEYLKFLRVSTDFVSPCGCEDQPPVHSYCMTAKIIKS
jgi:hypothetical protein